jgi:glutamyl-tRNA(Gln) amidotransferase subunit D
MGERPLHGYRGHLREVLDEIGAGIGDLLKVGHGEKSHKGTLMPRVVTADDWHIVLKLKTGYNIGITYYDGLAITRLGEAEKPNFRPPPLPPMQKDLPKVSIVSTGGTIASRVDYVTGGVHAAISSRDLLSIVPELSEIAIIDADILYSVFSEDVDAVHWSGIARKIAEKIKSGLQGIVITHGTDTLGYSSAALSFALRGISVPVIFVGSQRSSDRPSSDAAMNLVGVVTAAAFAPFAGVVVGMHETTSDTNIIFHKGTKVRKCHTSARYAFQSVNAEPVARFVDGRIEMNSNEYMKRDEGVLELLDRFEEKVALVKFHPGLKPQMLDWFVDYGYRGIIFEGTGLGHVSSALYDVLERAVKAGVYVGMAAQCLWGRINMNVYSTGRELQKIGVEPLGDMLPETAFVKLRWALANTDDLKGASELMGLNIAGEYSDRTLYTGRFG